MFELMGLILHRGICTHGTKFTNVLTLLAVVAVMWEFPGANDFGREVLYSPGILEWFFYCYRFLMLFFVFRAFASCIENWKEDYL